jgi:hypothetical protein
MYIYQVNTGGNFRITPNRNTLRRSPSHRQPAFRQHISVSNLLVEDGLRLTTETRLLHVVTPSTLSMARLLALLILRDFVRRVLSALGTAAVRIPGLWDVHHCCRLRGLRPFTLLLSFCTHACTEEDAAVVRVTSLKIILIFSQ